VSALDRARAAARSLLADTIDAALPEWRACFSTDGTDGPTAVAPVCADEDHEPTDGNVYNCCPEPVIEVEWPELAEYLAALLNADRGNAAAEQDTREGESTPLPHTDAHTAFMLLGTTPSLRGLRTELRIEGRPPLVGRYIGFGSRKAQQLDGFLIEPFLFFERGGRDEGGGAQ
jgi:hypothetical protein